MISPITYLKELKIHVWLDLFKSILPACITIRGTVEEINLAATLADIALIEFERRFVTTGEG